MISTCTYCNIVQFLKLLLLCRFEMYVLSIGVWFNHYSTSKDAGKSVAFKNLLFDPSLIKEHKFKLITFYTSLRNQNNLLTLLNLENRKIAILYGWWCSLQQSDFLQQDVNRFFYFASRGNDWISKFYVMPGVQIV